MADQNKPILVAPEMEKKVLVQWAQQTINFCFVVRSCEIRDAITIPNKGVPVATESLQMAHDFWEQAAVESKCKDSEPARIIFARMVLDFCHKHRFPDPPAS